MATTSAIIHHSDDDNAPILRMKQAGKFAEHIDPTAEAITNTPNSVLVKPKTLFISGNHGSIPVKIAPLVKKNREVPARARLLAAD